MVSAAVAAEVEGGHFRQLRIALGSVGPVVFRARQAEDFLEGQAPGAAAIGKAAALAAGEAQPIDDHRASAWYRRHLVEIYVGRLLRDVLSG